MSEKVYNIIFCSKSLKICTWSLLARLYVHAKFGVVSVKDSTVTLGGGGESDAQFVRVFEIPV